MDWAAQSVARDGKGLVLSVDDLRWVEPAGWQFRVEMAVSGKRKGILCQQSRAGQHLKSRPLLTRQAALGRCFAGPGSCPALYLARSVLKAGLPSAWAHCAGLQFLARCLSPKRRRCFSTSTDRKPESAIHTASLLSSTFIALHIFYNGFLLTRKSLSNTMTPSSIHI